jgi:hypothetical protein
VHESLPHLVLRMAGPPGLAAFVSMAGSATGC